ncbi:MAG TPA: radical SAM protein [Bacteroidales bacterium]|nr:radical SAM protein [Bacteroidales bacterium]
MSGFMFNQTVFGPVRSRRLGNSLGINLLAVNKKVCTFNCIYCDRSWSPDDKEVMEQLPTREQINESLETKLIRLKAENNIPDSITFAGYGEPTIHPEFTDIIDDTLQLRNQFFPHAEVTVLSNASMIHKPDIFEALNRVDNNILKLDAGLEATFQLINKPRSEDLTLDRIVQNLQKFGNKAIIQTLFVTGKVDGIPVDNTTTAEVHAWLNHLRFIRPRYVMLYTIDRQTTTTGLNMVPRKVLNEIADKLRQIRIKYNVY